MCWQSSMPVRSGITQSAITRSGLCLEKMSIASWPFLAKKREYGFFSRVCSTSLRNTAESSAMSTLVMPSAIVICSCALFSHRFQQPFLQHFDECRSDLTKDHPHTLQRMGVDHGRGSLKVL